MSLGGDESVCTHLLVSSFTASFFFFNTIGMCMDVCICVVTYDFYVSVDN